ncbi:MAG: ABC transporter ATP-binding protein [Nanoarchaeota archaeon]|nr:ABC transporter ATP-binding protein [Nanoarchaeota archaeon]
MQPIVSLRNITKKFGKRAVINDISFDIYEREIFGIMGESGSGKTTLLRTLIGFYRADGGHIYSYGQDLTKYPEIVKKKFGFASQDNCFYQDLTPMENLKYFGKLYKINSKVIRQRSEQLLRMVDLWAAKDRVAQDLSGGMQRRLDLCCALMHQPRVLVLDEPTSGLDPMLRKHMWSLIQKINETGVTIIVSSHLLEEMEHLCTSIAMIKESKLLGKGTPDQLKNLYSRNEEIHLETYPGRYRHIVKRLMEKGISLSFVRYEKHKVVMYTPNAEKALLAIANTLQELNENLLEIEINKPTLSEVFEAFSRYKVVQIAPMPFPKDTSKHALKRLLIRKQANQTRQTGSQEYVPLGHETPKKSNTMEALQSLIKSRKQK